MGMCTYIHPCFLSKKDSRRPRLPKAEPVWERETESKKGLCWKFFSLIHAHIISFSFLLSTHANELQRRPLQQHSRLQLRSHSAVFEQENASECGWDEMMRSIVWKEIAIKVYVRKGNFEEDNFDVWIFLFLFGVRIWKNTSVVVMMWRAANFPSQVLKLNFFWFSFWKRNLLRCKYIWQITIITFPLLLW